MIHKLKAILISVSHSGLVRANEEFTKWMLGDKTMPFGENNRHVSIKLIDFEDVSQNSFVVTNQYRVRARETKIPDLVFFINGLPVVVGEAKTPVRPSVSWLDGAHEVHKVYENAIPQLFVPAIFSFATEGKELFYGSVRCPLQQWSPWRIEEEENILPIKSLAEVGKQLSHLMHPKILLDILQNFALFATDKKKRRIKIVCRYQQYEGANKIIQRVLAGQIKKGLIWHFQGSGKSLLMVFAAQKLRKMQQLKSPTVIIVIDRVDLDSQITGTFHASDVPNMVSVNSISELNDLLEKDTRKILITTIHKFKKHAGNPKFKKLSERLEDLRHKAEVGLISNIEFVKELCKIAKEAVQAEKEVLTQQEQKSAKTALTELFLDAKTEQTPAVVERIVEDIDSIVKIVRFPGWQTTTSGEREVQKSLRKTLLKYKLHKDQALFTRAYEYIKEYY